MKKLNQILAVGALGLAGMLSGCAEENSPPSDVELSKGKIGTAEVVVIKETNIGDINSYRLDIYEEGMLRSRLNLGNNPPKGFIQYDDRVIDLRKGEEVLSKENRPDSSESSPADYSKE